MRKLDKYLRLNLMPNFTCLGCIPGIAWALMIRVIDKINLNQSETVMVCAISRAG